MEYTYKNTLAKNAEELSEDLQVALTEARIKDVQRGISSLTPTEQNEVSKKFTPVADALQKESELTQEHHDVALQAWEQTIAKGLSPEEVDDLKTYQLERVEKSLGLEREDIITQEVDLVR